MNRAAYRNIVVAAGAIFVMWCFRAAVSGTLSYGFIVTNILLAAVPLLIEPLFATLGRARITMLSRQMRGLAIKLGLGILGLVWLLFLPNSFYIVTDFMHLNSQVLVNQRNDGYYLMMSYEYVRGDALYLIDAVLIFSAAVFGACLGAIALWHAYFYLSRKAGQLVAGISLAAIILVNSIGVYIGRFGRWNSWEALAYPHAIVFDFMRDLTSPERQGRIGLVIVTLIVLQLGSMAWVRFAPSVRSEPRAPRRPK